MGTTSSPSPMNHTWRMISYPACASGCVRSTARIRWRRIWTSSPKRWGNKGTTSREIIRNYFLKDFFADHCKIYQKCPIYWLFDSGKQNGFKALVYLHRYTPDTIGKLRVDYLHRLQRVYASEIERMQDMIDNSKNQREVAVSTKRKEKLQKQLKECREYDEKIAHLALARIELDLDDGVKVNYEKVQTAADGKKYPVLGKV